MLFRVWGIRVSVIGFRVKVSLEAPELQGAAERRLSVERERWIDGCNSPTNRPSQARTLDQATNFKAAGGVACQKGKRH